MIAAIIILQLIDSVSTWYAIERKGAVEGNPIVKWLMERLGLIGGLAVVKVPFIAFMYFYGHLVHDYILYGLIALYVAVVGNNIYRILR